MRQRAARRWTPPQLYVYARVCEGGGLVEDEDVKQSAEGTYTRRVGAECGYGYLRRMELARSGAEIIGGKSYKATRR